MRAWPGNAVTQAGHNGHMRILHTMLRVGNLQRAIDFYTQVLGMQLLRTYDIRVLNYCFEFF